MYFGAVQLLDCLDPGILAGDYAVAGVEVGPGKGNAHRAVRVNCGGAQAEIDLPGQRCGEAAVGLHDDELDLVRIAQQVLGDFVRHVDLEPDQLAGVVHIGERR